MEVSLQKLRQTSAVARKKARLCSRVAVEVGFWQAIAIRFIPFSELSECKVIFTSNDRQKCASNANPPIVTSA